MPNLMFESLARMYPEFYLGATKLGKLRRLRGCYLYRDYWPLHLLWQVSNTISTQRLI